MSAKKNRRSFDKTIVFAAFPVLASMMPQMFSEARTLERDVIAIEAEKRFWRYFLFYPWMSLVDGLGAVICDVGDDAIFIHRVGAVFFISMHHERGHVLAKFRTQHTFDFVGGNVRRHEMRYGAVYVGIFGEALETFGETGAALIVDFLARFVRGHAPTFGVDFRFRR